MLVIGVLSYYLFNTKSESYDRVVPQIENPDWYDKITFMVWNAELTKNSDGQWLTFDTQRNTGFDELKVLSLNVWVEDVAGQFVAIRYASPSAKAFGLERQKVSISISNSLNLGKVAHIRIQPVVTLQNGKEVSGRYGDKISVSEN
ncbi:hypothetical protein FJZ18_03570 [Candidatus Pacearchaeota archaeon]|nr:hypothetical protein [Candidatus Pacearchaeota archaeon]